MMNTTKRLNFSHHLPSVEMISCRHPFIVDFCKGKKVLHIGCVDSGLLEERYIKNDLLHQQIDKVAILQYGIDIDSDGIEFLKSKGFENLFSMDINDEKQRIILMKENFDIIILSEVIEHLTNPGIMLESVKTLMDENTQLLVSVPNAFNASNIWTMLKGIEYVHPDHNYYFSYVTLNNTLQKNGLDITKLYVYSFNKYAEKNTVSYLKLFYWDLARKYRSSNNITSFYKKLYNDFLY